MSLRTRRIIAYWLLMAIGFALIVIQALKYYHNEKFQTFDYTVFCVAIILVLAPARLVKLVEGILTKKTNANNG